MTIRALYNTVLPQSCGVGELGIFRRVGGTPVKDITPLGGAGWLIVSFTPARSEYKEAYEALCKRWKLVYQSPVRINKRTQREFFFCIFDTEK